MASDVETREPGSEMPIDSGRATDGSFDVCVIGGGVNGSGVARDLALRGAKVVLFERNDLAFGASGNSSGMIHGGVRYLQSNPKVTKDSCRDSGYIQKIARLRSKIITSPSAPAARIGATCMKFSWINFMIPPIEVYSLTC